MRKLYITLSALAAFATHAETAAATTITIPAGGTATIGNATLGGCNANEFGYVLGSNTAPRVRLSSKAAACIDSEAAPGATIGPVTSATTLILYLDDQSCAYTYFSDGTSTTDPSNPDQTPFDVNHATVQGIAPYQVYINDGGPYCGSDTGDNPPAAGSGNLIADVTVTAPPPTVAVTAPDPPGAQNGYFNAADLAAGGGSITLSVSASDNSLVGVNSISCNDGGTDLPVGNVSGSGSATMTGTVSVNADGIHAITCTATDNYGDTGSSGSGNSATVKIDSRPPVLSLPAAPRVVAATTASGTTLSSYPVSASDPGSTISPTLACTPTTPVQLPIGNTKINCTATDEAGNTTRGAFTVTVTPPGPATVAFGRIATAASRFTPTIICTGVPGQTCSGSVTATTRHGSKVLTVATGAYNLAAGATAAVPLKLNGVGLRLMDQRYRLVVTVALPGSANRTVTLHFMRSRAKVYFTGTSRSYTVFSSLTGLQLPPGAKVQVTCSHGARCRGTFHARGLDINLSKLVVGKRFPAGSRVTVTITAPGYVGTVSVIRIVRDNTVYTKLCLPPGARRASRCLA